jgi:hypothetical protein
LDTKATKNRYIEIEIKLWTFRRYIGMRRRLIGCFEDEPDMKEQKAKIMSA